VRVLFKPVTAKNFSSLEKLTQETPSLVPLKTFITVFLLKSQRMVLFNEKGKKVLGFPCWSIKLNRATLKPESYLLIREIKF